MTKTEAVELITREILNMSTIDMGSHELSGYKIKRALEEAYDAGERAAIIRSHGLEK